MEPTNICVYSCSFCSYSRLIKHREQGWEYTVDQIMDIIKKYDGQAVTEVHITGGVVPKQDLAFYTELFKRIKAHRPDLHIKALTPVELHYIFKKAKVTYADGMKILKEAGLGSMPGGGAEIFDKEIRDKIAGENVPRKNGCRYMKLGTKWESIRTQRCCTDTLKHLSTASITWKD